MKRGEKAKECHETNPQPIFHYERCNKVCVPCDWGEAKIKFVYLMFFVPLKTWEKYLQFAFDFVLKNVLRLIEKAETGHFKRNVFILSDKALHAWAAYCPQNWSLLVLLNFASSVK